MKRQPACGKRLFPLCQKWTKIGEAKASLVDCLLPLVHPSPTYIEGEAAEHELGAEDGEDAERLDGNPVHRRLDQQVPPALEDVIILYACWQVYCCCRD